MSLFRFIWEIISEARALERSMAHLSVEMSQ
jgi:hypothetical protein